MVRIGPLHGTQNAAPSVGALEMMDRKTDDNVGRAYIALSCVAGTICHVRPKYNFPRSLGSCVRMLSRAIPWRPGRDRRSIEWICVAGIGNIQFFVGLVVSK
jgi:hypothetical protein